MKFGSETGHISSAVSFLPVTETTNKLWDDKKLKRSHEADQHQPDPGDLWRPGTTAPLMGRTGEEEVEASDGFKLLVCQTEAAFWGQSSGESNTTCLNE